MRNASPTRARLLSALCGSSILAACFAPDFVVDPPHPSVSGAGHAGMVVAGTAGQQAILAAGAAGKALSNGGSAGVTTPATVGTGTAGTAGSSSRAGGTAGVSAGAGAGATAGNVVVGAGGHSGASPTAGGAGAGRTAYAGQSFAGTPAKVAQAGMAGTAGASTSMAGTAGASTSMAGASGFSGNNYPSCSNLATRCQGESCCTTLAVPGGSFRMGRSDAGTDKCPGTNCGADDQPEHTVTVAAYFLDKYEVTVGRFRQFVTAYTATAPQGSAGSNPHVLASGWNSTWTANLPATQSALMTALGCDPTLATWTKDASTKDDLPINCVDWYLAYAFCAWDKGRLPTEAEWEFAAAGGDDNLLYPWGSTQPDPAHAVYSRADVTGLVGVGSALAGAGKWKQTDLSGSVWEWTFDGYASNWYGDPAASGANPANSSVATERSARGGSWADGVGYLRSTARYPSAKPTQRVNSFGIRCARDVP